MDVQKSFSAAISYLATTTRLVYPLAASDSAEERHLSDRGGYQGLQELERSLMLKKICRIVAEAKRESQPIRADQHAPGLLADFPNVNMSLAGIREEILHAAREAGIPVE